eukprot:GHRQ01019536.1.p1 GENE.GHRQ01019536.1~~GHRQ01019536.1.p1  ORF type:complete len:234 (+),score=65.68 GHRQ01019536.1:480-1181(+)
MPEANTAAPVPVATLLRRQCKQSGTALHCQRLHTSLWLLNRAQLSERHAGNKAYRQQQHVAALQHYQRALAVVNFVVGCSADEQAEVAANKAAVLLNIAAVHMALQVCASASPVVALTLQHLMPGDLLDVKLRSVDCSTGTLWSSVQCAAWQLRWCCRTSLCMIEAQSVRWRFDFASWASAAAAALRMRTIHGQVQNCSRQPTGAACCPVQCLHTQMTTAAWLAGVGCCCELL